MGPTRPRFAAVPTALAFAVAVTVALAPSRARAQEAPYDSTSAEEPRYRLAPVVVTGERIPVSADRVPLDITVIDRDRLETSRQYFLSETLREAPAVDVQRSGSLGKLTDVRLRGADPRHTLVLFDGLTLNGPWLGSFDFADLTDPGLSRVEVLGGPASSLYGSGAVGGVIQVMSPAAAAGAGAVTDRRLRAFAEYGEDATFRQGALWSGPVGRGGGGLGVTHLTSDGMFDRDGYEGWSGNASYETPIGEANRLRVSALGFDGVKELPYDYTFDPLDTTLGPFGSSKQVYDPNYEEKDRLLAGSALWTRAMGAKLSVEGEVSGLSGRIVNDNRPNAGPGSDFQNTTMRNSRGAGSLRARVRASETAQAVVGAEYRGEQVDRDDASSFGGFASTSEVDEGVHTRALYAQGHWEGGARLLADAGIRLDDHSLYGAYGLPRFALGVRVPEAGLKLRGGYGRAFTAPTLSDLYYPGYSSTTLEPERSTTWEAGLDGSWRGGFVTAAFTWHTTDFENLIQSNSFFEPENIGEARIEGEEYSVRLTPKRGIGLTAQAAHLVAKKLTEADPDPDRRLAKRPAWRYGVSGQAAVMPALTLTGAWRWVDSVRDPFNFIDAEGRVLDGDNPGYAALDLGFVASLARWAPVDLNVRVSNVLDREYSEVKGYPARGRAVAVALGFAR
jgi:vitamin B12 transporter